MLGARSVRRRIHVKAADQRKFHIIFVVLIVTRPLPNVQVGISSMRPRIFVLCMNKREVRWEAKALTYTYLHGFSGLTDSHTVFINLFVVLGMIKFVTNIDGNGQKLVD